MAINKNNIHVGHTYLINLGHGQSVTGCVIDEYHHFFLCETCGRKPERTYRFTVLKNSIGIEGGDKTEFVREVKGV